MRHDDDKAFGAKLRAGLAPVPAAAPDLRTRIAAMTETSVAEPRRWNRAVPYVAAMAASVLLFVATPYRGVVTAPEISAEESYVVETFASVFDDAADWLDIDE